jgi:hypothetical protein
MSGRCNVPGMIQPTDRLCGVRLDLHPSTSEAQLAPQEIASERLLHGPRSAKVSTFSECARDSHMRDTLATASRLMLRRDACAESAMGQA